jgi:hypothetical protein
MRATTYAAIIVAGIFWCGFAHATFSLIGSGNHSCGRWLEVRKGHDILAVAYGQWVVGFISGAAYADKGGLGDPLKKTDADGVYYWMDEYCRTHATVPIVDAAKAFIDSQKE